MLTSKKKKKIRKSEKKIMNNTYKIEKMTWIAKKSKKCVRKKFKKKKKLWLVHGTKAWVDRPNLEHSWTSLLGVPGQRPWEKFLAYFVAHCKSCAQDVKPIFGD